MSSLKDKINYQFDNFMTKNPFSQIVGLAVMVLIIIASGALLAFLLINILQLGEIPEDMQGTFFDKMWWTFMRVIDPGTIVGDNGVIIRIISAFATFGGILIFSILIGVLSSKIEEKLEDLKKGRTKVIEKGHTVILGWSPKIFTIIQELVIANENQRRGIVVVMAERSIEEMYDEINSRIDDFKTTRVICRTGNPIDIVDIDLVSINKAKSIIILSEESAETDTKVIKGILAITNNPKRKKEPYNIVAEVFNLKNKDIIEMVGGEETEVTFTNDLISRLVVQISRQGGLSVVYNEILSFDGNEFYFVEDKNVIGKKFGEAIFGYKASIPIGFKRGETISINPDATEEIKEGDELIVLTEDDDTCKFTGINKEVDKSIIISKSSEHSNTPEHTIILGWNKEVYFIINELNKYVVPGSTLKLVGSIDKEEASTLLKKHCPGTTNLAITYREASFTEREVIESLSLEKTQNIIILTDETNPDKDIEEKDADTLIALLLLRETLTKRTIKGVNIVSEMLNPKNKELAEVTRINDFIVSSKIVSMILAQVSEQREISMLYNEIFRPEGSEIYLKPLARYIQCPVKATFNTLIQAALDVGHLAIGYRLAEHQYNKDLNYGIIVNPGKTEEIEFGPDDMIIVLAED
jgi:K+/H+ antiporter YhaU regulatory subunit KhtT